MNNKKKIILIISSILITITLLIGGTFAFFGWKAEKEALVNVTVSSGTGSCELIDDNDLEIFPTYSKYHGRKIKLHAKQEMAEKAYITWDMVINEINGLQDSTFKYELVNMTTGESYGSGTFENITNEEGSNTITFSNNEEVLGYNRDYEFMLYLWIDGTLGNNSLDMSNQKFDFDMNCSITGTDNGVVTEQNVLMHLDHRDYTSNDYFLKSETITRGEIKSVTFVENANIPEGAIDVSKAQNNSVMMWNSEADSEGLYDIYIGSKQGKVIIESANRLFQNLSNVISIDLDNVNGLYVNNMVLMFSGCTKLISIDLGKFDTSNVTNMGMMFKGCSSLTSLNLSNFNTSNVISMVGMFNGCSELISLDLSNFDTGNVTEMNHDYWLRGGMFQNCHKLKTLIFGEKFKTQKLKKFENMFTNCRSLTSIDLSGFDNSSATTMEEMFSGCNSLTSLDLSSFNNRNVNNMIGMFKDCSSLTSLDLSNFNTNSVTKMRQMFAGCSSLTSLDLSNFNTSKVTEMHGMFLNCSSLTSLLLTNFDVTNVTHMGDAQYGGMFAGCSSLTSLDLTSFKKSAAHTMYRMFAGCTNLKKVDLRNFESTYDPTIITQMFMYDVNLQELYLNSFDFSNDIGSYGVFNSVPNTIKVYVKDAEQQSFIISQSKNRFPTENVIISPIVVAS